MAKASISKKYTLSASGILSINDEYVGLENTETGEMIDFRDLLSDFADKSVKFSINYDEEYGTENE